MGHPPSDSPVHRQVEVKYNDETVTVDEQLAELLPLLWWFGVDTDCSCQNTDEYLEARDHSDDHKLEPANREPHVNLQFADAPDMIRFIRLLEYDHPVGEWNLATYYDGGFGAFVEFPLTEVPGIVTTLRREALHTAVLPVAFDPSLWIIEDGEMRLTFSPPLDADGLLKMAAQYVAAANELERLTTRSAETSGQPAAELVAEAKETLARHGIDVGD